MPLATCVSALSSGASPCLNRHPWRSRTAPSPLRPLGQRTMSGSGRESMRSSIRGKPTKARHQRQGQDTGGSASRPAWMRWLYLDEFDRTRLFEDGPGLLFSLSVFIYVYHKYVR